MDWSEQKGNIRTLNLQLVCEHKLYGNDDAIAFQWVPWSSSRRNYFMNQIILLFCLFHHFFLPWMLSVIQVLYASSFLAARSALLYLNIIFYFWKVLVIFLLLLFYSEMDNWDGREVWKL